MLTFCSSITEALVNSGDDKVGGIAEKTVLNKDGLFTRCRPTVSPIRNPVQFSKPGRLILIWFHISYMIFVTQVHCSTIFFSFVYKNSIKT